MNKDLAPIQHYPPFKSPSKNGLSMTHDLMIAGIAALSALITSSGFWAYVQKKNDTKSATDRLIMGLGYDKIVHLGMRYIEQGWITKDEYEDFRTYMYEPYKGLGGNGVAERIMQEVSNLPLVSRAKYDVVKPHRIKKEIDE